ncbi:methyl-accepting chemotaxis protein, partial [Hydrogenophaga borbori]
DQMTQQNAALVEQSAAAAQSLKEQADRLAQVVQVFRIGHDAAPQPTPAPAPSAPLVTVRAPSVAKPTAPVPTRAAVESQPAADSKPATESKPVVGSKPAAEPRPAPRVVAPAAASAEGEWESF